MTSSEMSTGGDPGPLLAKAIDTTVASIARVYDCFLGGKDNYAVHREGFEEVNRVVPHVAVLARAQRQWLVRVTRYLAGLVGIDQFLDCGAGLPTAENTHQTAQYMNPDARVIYVDNDPVVAVHGRALLEENDRTHLVVADLTRPDEVFAHPTVTKFLDLDRPIALIQSGTIHHVPDSQRPLEIMQRYIDLLPPGSYLAVAHLHNPHDGGKASAAAQFVEDVFTNSSMGSGFARTRSQIESYFDDLELLEPGIVRLREWWPDGPLRDPLNEVDDIVLCGVARKV
jgi:S-adenosyl methyltransferase